MSTFDQRGQQVVYQYNAAGDITFDSVKSVADLDLVIDKLKSELTAARASGSIDEDTEALAKSELIRASTEAKATEPNKARLEGFLTNAKTCLESVNTVGGIVSSIAKAIEVVNGLL